MYIWLSCKYDCRQLVQGTAHPGQSSSNRFATTESLLRSHCEKCRPLSTSCYVISFYKLQHISSGRLTHRHLILVTHTQNEPQLSLNCNLYWSPSIFVGLTISSDTKLSDGSVCPTTASTDRGGAIWWRRFWLLFLFGTGCRMWFTRPTWLRFPLETWTWK